MCKSFIEELEELGTDPDIELAVVVKRQRQQIDDLNKTVDKCRSVIKELCDAYTKASGVIEQKKALITSLRQEIAFYENADQMYKSTFETDKPTP